MQGVPHFNALARVTPCKYADKLYLSRTRMIFLPDTYLPTFLPDRAIEFSFVMDKIPERDGRTDRQTESQRRSELRAMRTRCNKN